MLVVLFSIMYSIMLLFIVNLPQRNAYLSNVIYLSIYLSI